MSDYEALLAEITPEIDRLLPELAASQRADVARVSSLSDYFYQCLQRDPALIAGLFDSGDMERRYDDERFATLGATATPENLDALLRRARRREQCRVIFRDLTRRADMVETTMDLSRFADAAIDTAVSIHYAANCEKFGEPLGRGSGTAQRMAVLALGKLGAFELNLSSDIDLVFLYNEQGMARSESGRELTNQEFFIRTARAVIASLDKMTVDGFVFRVDMRLRPYGESGALILHRDAMEKYFYNEGRDWERYAFIKARACAGDVASGEDFLAWLAPFVYRRHLDYGAIDSLREMKRLINFEVDTKELHDDLKLGHGGIREIEFIVQAHQIIWGGNEAHLRQRRLLDVLSTLTADGLLPEADANALRAAYFFLRNSEHAVQAEADRQTQRLPDSDLSRHRLAKAMGFGDYEAYRRALDDHRQLVRDCFEDFMSSNRAEKEALVEGNLFWISIWREPESDDSKRLLADVGFKSVDQSALRLAQLEVHLEEGEVQEIGASRIDRLMPVLLRLVAREANPDETLERVLSILDSIKRRSTYVAYLLENSDALTRTVQLCAMSPWVAEQLARFPILLYELSDRVTHETVFERDKLFEEMAQLMQNLEAGDLEGQMDSLRQFRNSAVLRVAVFELLDLLPLMKASDALTHIAELVLQRAFELAWQYLVRRHGEPGDSGGEPAGPSFAIIAYGKLGGIELGYGSDLDLVFLHDADNRGRTDGDKSVENSVFYLRLGQRIVHILSSFTRFGVLYETDMRLRPDGNKGPLVCTLANYERYLAEDAWTWEHQALVRARFVAGDARLRERFEQIRHQVLASARDREKLLEEVVSMREKMRRHLEKGDGGGAEDSGDEVLISGFDLKHGAGAIVDIEFLVQFLVLANSGGQPLLTRWTDKMRILDDLKAHRILEPDEVRLLQKAYLAYRAAVHYQWLGGTMATFEHLSRYRADVVDIWQRYMT